MNFWGRNSVWNFWAQKQRMDFLGTPCIQVIAWRQGGAPTYSVPAAAFRIFTVLTFEDDPQNTSYRWRRSSYWSTYFVAGDPQINIRSKICVAGDPHTIVRPTLYFEDDPQNIVLFKPQFWGWSSKYCTFKTVISLKKTLHKCSEFRTKYGTN